MLQSSEEHNHEIHCSRERSRTAYKIIEEYLIPFVEQENYELSHKCKLHPGNDMFRDQEEHKIHMDVNEWRCGYCKKSFRAEKFLDQHFDNRHYNLLNVSHNCLADLCGALHCDHVANSIVPKTKCNPAAAARNRHLCESLADSCFPVHQGPSASRLHGNHLMFSGGNFSPFTCKWVDSGCVFISNGSNRSKVSNIAKSCHSIFLFLFFWKYYDFYKSTMSLLSLRFGQFCDFRPKVCFFESGSKMFKMLPFLSDSLTPSIFLC
ncbi:putative transcription factor C2H2 family [Helianthus annuus]|nr:putative transcription factor C2H2 family [Helianthus annuus]